MELTAWLYILLGLVGFVAGWVDSIAGGGGLIVLPVLLSVGIPPDIALATNKLQGCGGTLSASLFFLHKKTISLKTLYPGILAAVAGSVTGAALITSLRTDTLNIIIPVLLVGLGLYFLFLPRFRIQNRQRIPFLLFLCTVPFFLALYDGFFGPGTGMFLTLSFMILAGFTIKKATAHAKIFNFISNICSLMYFLYAGTVFWQAGLVMMLGQITGAQIGARMVLGKGAAIIRPLVVISSLAMALKLLIEQFLPI